MKNDNQQDSSGIEMYDSHILLFEKKIWKMNDVMSYTGLSRGTIYNKASRGEIPFRKTAGRLYFCPDEIHEWILTGGEQ